MTVPVDVEDVAALVAAADARSHLQELRAAGVGTRAVAAAAGVARGTVRDVLAGRSDRIRATTSRRLLSVGAAEVTANRLVDAGPTLALLEVLLDRGYPMAWIAEQLGAPGRPARLQIGRRRVRASTARAVVELAARVDGPAGAMARGAGDV